MDMADEQRMWSQRHVHESSTVSYGQFGTPVYRQSSQSWEFPRRNGFTETRDEDATEQGGARRLEIFTDPQIVIQSTNTNPASISETGGSRSLVKDSPDLAAASLLINAVDKEEAINIATSHQGSRIAFGSALSLSVDGIDSGNLVVPIITYATGLGGETLSLACLDQERLPFSTGNNSALYARVPSLIGDSQVSWSGIEPILQLSFSQRNVDGHSDTFLLVRRASQTSILEPLSHRGASFRAPDQKSSWLDPNPLVTLHTSVTGDHRHVDAAFHPLDHRKVAVIDEQGNWSIWKIRGRRSTTARVLYQARLRTSGKVFSWTHRKRPAGVGLFFDGWHKIVWTSSDGQEIDRLLVSNRQMVKLFTLGGQELCSIDPRLDLGKASYVLDMRPGPRINICLILTTSKLLVFDIGQQEWKDPVSSKGPALLCAFEHFQNSAGLSLKITDLQFGDESLVALYSTSLHRLSVRQLMFQEVDGKTSTTITDACSISLPVQLSEGRVAAVMLASTEIAYSAGQIPTHQEALLRVIIQHENLSIYSSWATVKFSGPTQKSAKRQLLIRLPPSRHLQRKSGLRVDDTDDEDDSDGFIASNTDEDDDFQDEANVSPQSVSAIVLGRLKTMKHVDDIYAEIQEQRIGNVSKLTTNTIEVSKRLESQLQDLALVGNTTPGCLSLFELTNEDARIADVEAESNELQQIFSGLNQDATDWSIASCYGNPAGSLVSTYNTMFDTFVDSLPSSVPNRARVQKERQYRSIALEQYLSSYTVRRTAGETKVEAERTQTASNASQLIFSDTLQFNDPESQHVQMLSASQPLPQTGPDLPNTSLVPSLLLDSLSRIQSYTRVTHNFEEILTQGSDTLDHFSSVFSHLPISYEEKPDDYKYQDRAMANAAEKAEARGPDIYNGSRAQRKAARLSRVRNRAEDFSIGLHGGKQNIHSRLIDKESGNVDRGVNLSGQRSQGKDAGSLPIRSSGEKFPGPAWRDKVAQSQHEYHLSDGHLPAESSSQAVMSGNFTATQPERGVFANRADAKGQDKVKKKKKRMAGF